MADWSIEGPEVRVVEERGLPLLRLRLRAPSERQLAAVEAALGGPLARIANRVAGTDPRAIWMGPADWLVLGARLDERLGQAIAAACEGTAHHAADVSAAHALHRVEGPGARDLIAQGCSIDLHPRAFAPGHSAVTLIAQIGVAIDQIDADGFRLITDRSYTPYLRTWLAHALAG